MRSPLSLALVLSGIASSYADSGVGPIGIDATGLQLPNSDPLNGAGIGIGQVEGARPRKPMANGGPDDATNSAPTVIPAQVYMGASTSTPGNGVTVRILTEVHAEPVASIMISTNGSAPGVAPSALLHASGHASLGAGQRDVALTANFIANRNGGDISAINLSIGLPLDGGESNDGGSHLSSFVDWSASHHDVLYVVAGREEEGGAGPVPSDNYNGITVAASDNIGSLMDVFDNTWPQNKYDEDAEGNRVSVDLLAPGVLMDAVTLGGGLEDPDVSGTSFAAPHVTGAVALLQQYGKYQSDNSVARWTGFEAENPNPRRHEVMKAILLNSADKLSGVHNSDRTIFKENAQRWDQTLAFSDPAKSLDEQMGAGHLNVRNALTNYEPGEYNPGIVPTIGWDFSPIVGSAVDYILDESVTGWVTVTLAWDRIVTSSEVGASYNSGTEFFNNPIADELVNLDLYLLDSDDT